nr:PREDICTED: cathepsin B-like cysteine proteinase 4 isoform X1 [Bemisia tabaci]
MFCYRFYPQAFIKAVEIIILVIWGSHPKVLAFVAPPANVGDLTAHLDTIAEHVNKAGATWTAGRNFPTDLSNEHFKNLVSDFNPLGDLPANAETCDCEGSAKELEEEDAFDAREQWKDCPSIKHITNQGACQSSWAVAAANVISDRQCVASNGTIKDLMSAHHLLSCCSDCGLGCNGGWPRKAFTFYQKHGVVTGGDYNSKQGCQPYELEPTSDFALSNDEDRDTPSCSKECTNKQYGKSLKRDLHFGKGVITPCCCWIKTTIREEGPVVTSMVVYEDFLTYKSGIYRHIWGKKIGYQTVRMIGWGRENDVDYWIAANSWGTGWGEKGFFRIYREKKMMTAQNRLSEAEFEYGYAGPVIKRKKH